MLLQWLVFSERTLRIDEVAGAISDLSCSSKAIQLSHARTIIESLSSLTVVIERHVNKDDFDWLHRNNTYKFEEVSLAHFSVKEYLSSQRILTGEVPHFYVEAELSHTAIGSRCLEYLLLFKTAEALTEEALEEQPLLYYAATKWHKHIRATSTTESTTKLCLQLLNSKTEVLRNWLRISDPTDKHRSYSRIPVKTSEVSSKSGLFFSSCCGLTEVTRQLLMSGTPWAAEEKISSLLAAAEHGHTAIVGLLLDLGCISIYSRNHVGQTALHKASHNGHEDTVRFLLDKKPRVRAKDHWGATPLHDAAHLSDDIVAQLLLQHGARVSDVDGRGNTPLHIAARANKAAVVRLLLDWKADCNAINKTGDMPLHEAASSNSTEPIKHLVAAGANLDTENEYNWSALYVATMHWNYEVVELLLEYGATRLFSEKAESKETLYQLAKSYVDDPYSFVEQYDIQVNDLDATIRIFLDRGLGNPDEYQDFLMLAASEGWDRIAEYVAASPAVDPLYRNDAGDTALHLIIKAVSEDGCLGYFELTCHWCQRLVRIGKALIERAGLEILTAKDSEGQCALERAIKLGWEDAAVLMIENGIPYGDIKPPYEESWLHFAAKSHKSKLVRAIADRGEHVNQRDSNGRTPVLLAVNNGHVEPYNTIETLLKYGASLKVQDNDGQTILHHWVHDYTWRDIGEKVSRLLLENGADLHAKDSQGRTAIELWEELDIKGKRLDEKILVALEDIGSELGLL
jgi:ankyrin repeat protein